MNFPPTPFIHLVLGLPWIIHAARLFSERRLMGKLSRGLFHSSSSPQGLTASRALLMDETARSVWRRGRKHHAITPSPLPVDQVSAWFWFPPGMRAPSSRWEEWAGGR